MPQIDALRAICVLAVMYTHFLPEPYWFVNVYWGGLGVRCFFVISGFLITTILLRTLQQKEFFPAYKVFLIRRLSRLFPLLILTLSVTYILGFMEVRNSYFWHVTYLSNFYFIKIGSWDGAVSHFWTLAVEEQFYLIWPIALALFITKNLYVLIACTILSSLAFRFTWTSLGLSDMGVWVLPPGSFDALGIGALLSLVIRNPACLRIMPWLATVGVSVWCMSKLHPDAALVKYLDIGSTGIALLFMWILAKCALGVKGVLGRVLMLRPLTHVGKVSYGIYLFHNFVPATIKPLVGENVAVLFVSSIAVTYLIATISYHFFETPLRSYVNNKWTRIT
jgi:peptidoglycan/LPS O-acetylase OafA/YrhL